MKPARTDLPEKHSPENTVVVRGDSMRPFFKPGDILTVSQALPANVRKGNVIVYTTAEGNHVVHRVLQVLKSDGGISFIAKGDNRLYPDEVFASSAFKGKISGRFRNGRVRKISRLQEIMESISAGLLLKLKKISYRFFGLLLPLFKRFLPIRWITVNDNNKTELTLGLFFGRVVAKHQKKAEKHLLWVHPVFKKIINIKHINPK